MHACFLFPHRHSSFKIVIRILLMVAALHDHCGIISLIVTAPVHNRRSTTLTRKSDSKSASSIKAVAKEAGNTPPLSPKVRRRVSIVCLSGHCQCINMSVKNSPSSLYANSLTISFLFLIPYTETEYYRKYEKTFPYVDRN